MSDDRYNIESGEDKAWRELAAAGPVAVSANSLAEYDAGSGTYRLEVMGETISVNPSKRIIENLDEPGRRPEYLLGLSIPIYLVQAKDIPPSGELVKELKGGGFFFRGSHTLPLDAIAGRYGSNRKMFLEAGRSLGGSEAGYGDAAFTFRALPRISMTFVLWLEDDEFPARASLLFDSNAGAHMALDAVWAVALVACQRMLMYGERERGL